MSESIEAQKAAWKEHVNKVKQKVAEGKLDPFEDPETQEQIRQANLDQAPQVGEEGYDSSVPLPRSPDQDPESPALFLPRKPYGRRTNQPVVTQAALEGGTKKEVLSRKDRSRDLKQAQPYERGRLGIDNPQDNQEANQQRHQIRQDMRKRGEDV